MTKRTKSPKADELVIADPETVLNAAQAAPKVFHIASYFQALYVMRGKGHSWRYLSDWLVQFNIHISHVHLHRLYTAEDARLDKFDRKELRKIGMPREMIDERLAKDDPTKRLIAADPEDELADNENQQRQ